MRRRVPGVAEQQARCISAWQLRGESTAADAASEQRTWLDGSRHADHDDGGEVVVQAVWRRRCIDMHRERSMRDGVEMQRLHRGGSRVWMWVWEAKKAEPATLIGRSGGREFDGRDGLGQAGARSGQVEGAPQSTGSRACGPCPIGAALPPLCCCSWCVQTSTPTSSLFLLLLLLLLLHHHRRRRLRHRSFFARRPLICSFRRRVLLHLFVASIASHRPCLFRSPQHRSSRSRKAVVGS